MAGVQLVAVEETMWWAFSPRELDINCGRRVLRLTLLVVVPHLLWDGRSVIKMSTLAMLIVSCLTDGCAFCRERSGVEIKTGESSETLFKAMRSLRVSEE